MTVAAPGSDVYDEVFEQHRPVLLGLAYRMLGSWWDAEDTVQDAWLRWRRSGPESVADPRGWLVTVTTRIALDQLRSARRQRETYVGPWVPEPVPTGRLALDPAETAEQRATVSLAALRLMEQLTPPERAVYLLREAFELPFQEIADALDVGAANARQLYHRAAARLAGDKARFAVDGSRHLALVDRFVAAAATGDRAGLQALLADDVVLWSDGGGKVRAALNPVHGPAKVMRFLMGVLDKAPQARCYRLDVNGGPAVLFVLGEHRLLLSFETRDGNIAGIQGAANPDKLRTITIPDRAPCFVHGSGPLPV
ncbi:RNA polymerase sigma factor SigJ [Yinghuangia soli]|uniref:RNA polymerase sigma factor SigJ n=1 Tax=Yinghuangia soli TaxID=2908204 RepID=A0AA41Q7A3_9ACTN|nr:RNA polymerase sigma factor SigJ [Yinghuangia soli]MCF2532823.1 RNA polymerase sigma factor SigJ [Yinghuangia soli]